MPLSLLAIALLVLLPVAWFVGLADEHEPLRCTTPSAGMANSIESIMNDHRTHLENVQVVDAHDLHYESLYYDSGKVYVDDVYVGVGTWGTNYMDSPGFRPGSQNRRWYSVRPVNALAKAISTDPFGLRSPNENKAARFSQHCVTAS